MRYFIFIVLAMLCYNQIRGQDLLQRVKQGTFNKELTINNDDSALAQKFINTNREELQVVSPFSSKTIDDQIRTNIDNTVSGAIVLEFNSKQIRTVVANKSTYQQFLLRIPIDDSHSFDLLLEESTALSDNFVLQTSEGEEINYEAPGVFYNGIIDGIPGSFATVSISEDKIEVILSDQSGNYILTEIKGTDNEYIMFNDYRLKETHSFSCGLNTDNFEIPAYHNPNETSRGVELKVRDNVEVYVEVDYDIYANHGFSTVQTMNYVLDVFRASVSVFEKELISLRLNKVLIWTTNNDPFNGITNFDEFGDQLWDWTCEGFTGADIAHYIGTTEGVGGLANGTNGFCDQVRWPCLNGGDETSHCASLGMDNPFVELNNSATTNLGYNVPSWELLVFCHEMGHIFGSPHTHDCVWNGNDTQIDDCGNLDDEINGDPTPDCYNSNSPIIPQNGGTIMSYCHLNSVQMNLSLGFGIQPGNLMRSTINNSSCIDNYEIACPEVETIEQAVTDNFTYDAKKEVLIHDSNVSTGFDPTFTGGERTIIYGNFQCPIGAGFNVTLNGCN